MLSRSSLFVGLACAALLACGRPKPELESKAHKVDDPADLEVAAKPEHRKRARKRAVSPMPETFAGFPRPDLTALDGIWLVESQQVGRGMVWVVEDQGSTLTTIDRHGRELAQAITLSSPCALRLTDDDGRAQARAIAWSGDRLIVTSKGAIALAAADGSLLACAGHRTYMIAADGRCRYTTEMLGAWSDPVEAKDACTLANEDGARVLIIAGQRLREHDGVWLDEIATQDVALRMDDREAAVAALAPKPAEAASSAPSGSETGEPVGTGETG